MATAIATTQDVRTELAHVPLELINPPSTNCRREPGDLDSLARSIRIHGVITPLKLRRLSGGQYEVVAGSRRFQAAQLAGLENVPAVIDREISEVERVSAQLAENIERLALTDLDQVHAVQQLFELGVTDEGAALCLGAEPAQITALRRIAALPPAASELIEDGTLSVEEASELAALDDPEIVDEVLVKMDEGSSGASAIRTATDTVRQRRIETAARAKLEKQGVTVIDAPLSYDFPASSKTRQLGTGYHHVNLPLKEHRKQPCHAAYINRWARSNKDAITYVCTDITRHAGDPAANIPAQFSLAPEEKKQQRAEKRAHKKEWRQSHAIRRDVAAQILADLDNAEAVARVTGELILDETHEAQAAVAAALLGQPELSDNQALAWLHAQVGTATPDQQLRIAVACLMARAETSFSKAQGDWRERDNVLAHFRMLDAHRYTLVEGERAHLVAGFSIHSLDEPLPRVWNDGPAVDEDESEPSDGDTDDGAAANTA